MGDPRERAVRRPDNVIGVSTGDEIIFRPENVRKMSEVIGPIVFDENWYTWRRDFENGAILLFGGDEVIRPGHNQRTSVELRQAQSTFSNTHFHMTNITRVEYDGDNHDAIRFVSEGEKGTAYLAIDQNGVPLYTTEKNVFTPVVNF